MGFLVRFGRYMTGDQPQGKDDKAAESGSPPTLAYSIMAFLMYTLALVICGICLVVYRQGQPALLYICPALIIGTFIVGLARGEINKMMGGITPESQGYGKDL